MKTEAETFPTEWHQVAAKCNAIATTNGFERPTWDKLLTKLILFVTELDEGKEFVYGAGDDPLEEELADATIRLLSILHGIWGTRWDCRIPAKYATSAIEAASRPILRFRAIEVILWRPLGRVCKAAETWRHENQDDTRMHLEFALRELWAVSIALGIDLLEQVELKCDKNMRRPKLHGKKRNEG